MINSKGSRTLRGILSAINSTGISATICTTLVTSPNVEKTLFWVAESNPKSEWYTQSYIKLCPTFECILATITETKVIRIAGFSLIFIQVVFAIKLNLYLQLYFVLIWCPFTSCTFCFKSFECLGSFAKIGISMQAKIPIPERIAY